MRRVGSGDQGMMEITAHVPSKGCSPSPAPAVAALGECRPSAADQEKQNTKISGENSW